MLGLLDQVGAFVVGQAGEAAAAMAVAAARQVRDQDVDLTGPAPALRRGVAKDRRISVEDSQMRHGRKSRSVLFDGYKRHVLRDLDTGLVPAVGIARQRARSQRHRLRERTQVEHALAHVRHWQGRRARYLGTRKNLLDLRHVATVHNLHVIARSPPTDSYQQAA